MPSGLGVDTVDLHCHLSVASSDRGRAGAIVMTSVTATWDAAGSGDGKITRELALDRTGRRWHPSH
jgi:hypothetical protein